MTVAVGMSGGVDSSVAARLLLDRGYRVIGLTMQVWDGSLALPDNGRSGCYGPGEARDIEQARRMAAHLGIPHHTVPLTAEYKANVLDYFRREYLDGRTPNPCVMCNRRVKFGAFLDKARAMGLAFDRFATGHYARVECDASTGRHVLLRGADPQKDQSYFLSHLAQDQLRLLILPLGELCKDEVRRLARAAGMDEAADQPESQDFIESDQYDAVFEGLAVNPGPIEDAAGHVLGQHRGIVYYTVGQRKGLGLSGTSEPLYVTGIDACRNTVIVGGVNALFSDGLTAGDINWIAVQGLTAPLRASVRIRQQHRGASATLTPLDGGNIEIQFDEPQMAVTPGQIAVFYNGDLVLGGGTILGRA
jgi:tRNA-specific 2-thiouridylase